MKALDDKIWNIIQRPNFSSNPEDSIRPWRQLIESELAAKQQIINDLNFSIFSLNAEIKHLTKVIKEK